MSDRLDLPLADLLDRLDPPEVRGVGPDALPAGIAAVVKFVGPDGSVEVCLGWSPSMSWAEALGLFTYAAQAVSSDVVEVDD